jgi:phage terminase Nu1 subunit (DNA packaging protein)
MALTKKLWSLNALEVETGRDRRTIGKALAGVPRDGTIGKNHAWHLTTALNALDRHDHPNGRGGDALDPAQERARKDRALAIRVELQNAEALGELVRVDDVVKLVTRDFSIVRSRVLAMPSKCASLVPASVRGIVFKTVDQEVRAALEELSADKAYEEKAAAVASLPEPEQAE